MHDVQANQAIIHDQSAESRRGSCSAGGLAVRLAQWVGPRLRISGRSMHRAAGQCCVLLALSLMAGRVGAQEYHVAAGGSDTASGSPTSPWRSIGHAAAVVAAGDTVTIHAGTYALTTQINFVNSGSAGHPITYQASTGDTVLINGGSGYCLGLQFRSYLIFKDLRFTTASTAVGAGMVYMEGTNHCEFLGCTFSGMPAPVGSENTAAVRCMQTDPGQSVGCVFRNNLFKDNRSPALRLYDTDGWIIENNEFVNCLEAVGGKDQPNNMLVRRNRITGGNKAFYFAGQSGCTNVTITENIVVGAGTAFEVGGLGTYGNLRDDIKLFNNTFYECRNLIVGWDDVYTRRQSYHSNIFFALTALNIGAGEDVAGRFVNLDKYGSVAVDPANYTMDWNCLSIPSGDTSLRFIDANIRAQTIAAWTTAHPPFEAHSIAADPRLVSAAAGDFHLQPTSPCRGTGRGGTDMGAYPRGDDGTVIGLIAGEAINHVPVAAAQSISTAVDVAKPITLSAADADGDPLSYAIVSGPAHGILGGSGAARTYTPAAGYSGGDSFTFTASDGTATSATAVVTITVSGDGTAPARPAAPLVSDAASPLPTLSGMTEAGATVRIYDGAVLVASLSADGTGAWSWTPGTALSGGTHAFAVTASDAAGNVSAISPSAIVSISDGGAGAVQTVGHNTGTGDSGGCGAGGLAVALALLAGLHIRSARRR